MEDDLKPKERFSGLAKQYSLARPDYSDKAIDFIYKHCRMKFGDLLVDVGSGTGISSRAFARRGLKVTGIEPNADMRSQAELANERFDIQNKPVYQNGSAELTGLRGNSITAVLAAQAFHWFDSEKCLIEFARILKPGGWVILLWNQDDESDLTTKNYSDLMCEYGKGKRIFDAAKRESGGKLLCSPLFTNGEKFVFKNQQTLNQDGLIDRALSSSYGPKDEEIKEKLIAALKQFFQQQQKNGLIILKYNLDLYLGCRS